MKRTELLQEFRKMRFEEAYEGWQEGRLTQCEAAGLLGVSERTFRRYGGRYEEDSLDGLIDQRLEQVSHCRAPVEDSSTHEWVTGQRWDPIVTMDDATNEHYSMFFVEQEGTASSLQGVREVIEARGLFSSFYSDRGSHYWHTPEAGGKVDRKNPTQFGCALNRLGIEMIGAGLHAAHSTGEPDSLRARARCNPGRALPGGSRGGARQLPSWPAGRAMLKARASRRTPPAGNQTATLG